MRSSTILMVLWLLNCNLLLTTFAQVPEVANNQPAPVGGLTAEQAQVADRFKKLEELLLRSAELEAVENPTRSALLQQAAQLGKQSQLADLLVRAATRLEKKQFSQAIEDQKTSRENLKRLLELLQSENRGERVREQRDQVRRWIEETDRLLRLQKSLSGRTEGGQELQQAASDQNKLADKAAEIAADLGGNKDAKEADPKTNNKAEKNESQDAQEKGDTSPGDNNPSSDKAQDKNSDKPESKDGDKDKKDGEESKQPDQADDKQSSLNKDAKDNSPAKGNESKDKSSDPNTDPKDGAQPDDASESPSKNSPQDKSQPSPAEKQKSSDPSSEQSSDSPSGQQGQDQQQAAPKDPMERAKQRIEQAQKKMQEAQKALEDAQRDGGVEKQREAEEELRAAIEELEEILRQLREEEIERNLATLETRLRRMLEMQTKVFEETTRLQEITGDQATRQVEIRASNLALEERKILSEGERAYLLLREEGSSAAFPEAIQQVNTDIGNVVERLGKADIGKLTTTIEQEIVSSLEEMVAALAQIQKEKKEKKQQQQGQQQQGEPGDQPLVDKLAELRLIRTLQLRINKRTDALSEMLDDPADAIGQVTENDILHEVKGLAERQSKIQQVTRDIVVGADK